MSLASAACANDVQASDKHITTVLSTMLYCSGMPYSTQVEFFEIFKTLAINKLCVCAVSAMVLGVYTVNMYFYFAGVFLL